MMEFKQGLRIIHLDRMAEEDAAPPVYACRGTMMGGL